MEQKKTLLKSINVLFIGTVLNVLISAITTPIITRIVSPSIYGELSFFNMYSNILYIILMLGLDHAYVRYFYKEDNVDYKKYLLFSCLKLPVYFIVLIIILSTFFSLFVDIQDISLLKKLGFNTYYILFFFYFNVLLLMLNRYSMLTLRLENNNTAYSIMTVTNKIIFVLVAVLSIMITDLDHLYSLIIATVMAHFVTTVISIIISRKIWSIKKNIRSRDGRFQKEIFKYGIPLIFSGLANWLFNGIDKIMLNYYTSYELVGIFAAAMNIVGLFSVVQITFNTLWVPITMKQYEKNPNDTSVYIKGNDIISFISFLLGITIILFKDVFVLLLGEGYREASSIISFLLLIPIMTMISETTVLGVNFKNKTYWHIIITVVSCIVNVVGNLLLIPKMGIVGAAISTGIAYIVFFTMRTIAGSICYKIKFNLSRIYFCIIIFTLFSIYSYRQSFNLSVLLGYIIIASLIMILYRRTVKDILQYIKNTIKNK